MSGWKLYTCQELVDRKEPAKKFKWNAVKLGVFYRCLLLDGKSFGKQSRVLITEASFDELVRYAYNVLGCIEPEPEFMSYEEVMETFPQPAFYRWTINSLGIFYHAGLLNGKRGYGEGRFLVTRQSVLNLIEFTAKRFDDISNKPYR